MSSDKHCHKIISKLSQAKKLSTYLPDTGGNTNGKYETVDRKILKPPCAGANKW
jgi:hypothetical protein